MSLSSPIQECKRPPYKRRYIIFTDLDGTLLDHDSYEREEGGHCPGCRAKGVEPGYSNPVKRRVRVTVETNKPLRGDEKWVTDSIF